MIGQYTVVGLAPIVRGAHIWVGKGYIVRLQCQFSFWLRRSCFPLVISGAPRMFGAGEARSSCVLPVAGSLLRSRERVQCGFGGRVQEHRIWTERRYQVEERSWARSEEDVQFTRSRLPVRATRGKVGSAGQA